MNLFSNQFYSNSIPSECHTLLVGKAFINNGKVTETYYKYDTSGNLIETKTLYPTRDYTVFSGEFDENGQTVFEFDLTGKTITDGILVISSIAVPTQETFYETHSEVGKGWLNTGSWSGKYFMADYYKCHDMDCFDGETKIGPFVHYPGTPGYTGYTKWVEDNRTQYVKTSYTKIVNEYPEKTEYNLNSNGWSTITNDLGSGTTSTTIPASSFVQGLNTIQFKESNIYSTKFDWVLYIDEGATPQEYVTTYTYDSYGNVTSMTDPGNNSKTYSYSSDYGYAYMTTATDALGNTLSVTYNYSTGEIASITNKKGYTTSYQYDILGRVTKKIRPDLSELEVVYDDTNNCATIFDELDHFTKRYFDGLSRLKKEEQYNQGQLYASETYTYDYLDNLISKTDAGGHTYQYEYDSRGRKTKMINPDNTFTTIDFDDAHATVTITDENSHITKYAYDWEQRLTEVREYTDPTTFHLTQFKYDQRGNITAVTNAKGEKAFCTYDSLFGATSITYPDDKIHSFTYDETGNLLTKQDGHGITTYLYDANQQLTEIQHPDQTTTQFTYDPLGNRLSVSNGDITLTYMYDNRNRLLSTTQEVDDVFYTVSYEYDAASRLVSITYPDQTVIANTYDDLNRLTSVEEYALFTYTPDSFMNTLTYANGVVTTLDYDQCHRPLSILAEKEGELLLSMVYTYDFGGNITEMTRDWIDPITSLPQTTTESYTYDALNRLLSASNGFGILSFEYDATGNRTRQIINGQVTDYTYSPYNRLATAGDWTFTYDANGNTLSRISDTDEWLYYYDSTNRLVEVQHNSQTVGTYVYNGNDQRIKKTEWNPESQQYETIIYLYSQGDVCYEKNVTTGFEAIFVYGPKGKIAKKVGDEVMYYHTDHLGSTRLLTDATGSPATAVEYYPFGNVEITGQNERYLFTGQETDSTGLYYYKARYYDPEIGRFLTEDTWGGDHKRPQTMNKYVYCMNNPLRYTDPKGNRARGDPDFYDYLLTQEPEEETTSESNAEEVDWKALGQALGFLTGHAAGMKFRNAGWSYDNLYHGVKENAIIAYTEYYGLEGEALEQFKEGFEETYNDGILNCTKDINKIFEDSEGEARQLFQDVREAIGSGLLLSGFSIPPGCDLALALDTIKTAYEGASSLKIAWQNIPEPEEGKPPNAGGRGVGLILFGMLIIIFFQKKKVN